MQSVLVIGAGQIGSLISFLLAKSNQYHVYLADVHHKNIHIARLPALRNIDIVALDATKATALHNFLHEHPVDALISSLPYYINLSAAAAAKKFNLHYFDLSEDIGNAQAITQLAEGAEKAFVPQCGLAPGFISIVANHLMQRFPTDIHSVKMRVGALPLNSSNSLQYSLTWSIDGLINEYGNPCHAIENGEETMLPPLDDLEQIKIDGLTYEAFNTSGGAGSLIKTYNGRVKHLSYKTIRYPGHCEKMRFLMNELHLNKDRKTLQRILENALPRTYQDVILVYVSVTGTQDNQFIEENYVKKFYSTVIDGIRWSGIQMTTASGICSVMDMVLDQPQSYKGFIRQEQFSLGDLLANPFGKYFHHPQ